LRGGKLILKTRHGTERTAGATPASRSTWSGSGCKFRSLSLSLCPSFQCQHWQSAMFSAASSRGNNDAEAGIVHGRRRGGHCEGRDGMRTTPDEMWHGGRPCKWFSGFRPLGAGVAAAVLKEPVLEGTWSNCGGTQRLPSSSIIADFACASASNLGKCDLLRLRAGAS